MRCPYCGKEMTEGIVSCSGGNEFRKSDLIWLDRNDDMPRPPGLRGNSRKLYCVGYSAGSPQIPAHCCDNCNKLILDTHLTDPARYGDAK